MNNNYFIDVYLLQDNEAINQYFYLNQSPRHRYQAAYNEEEQKGEVYEKLHSVEKKFQVSSRN